VFDDKETTTNFTDELSINSSSRLNKSYSVNAAAPTSLIEEPEVTHPSTPVNKSL
jgi:hypothetical protein